ncbi:DUF72 domain-containing protein [Sphingomonas oligophenolica]|uniref:DUF72 domain-containing protein n=1 Tax=Sphingomonas oligophenolica TaxID=301154 RepID=A0A502C2V9_9SPHN|nr:DUF72 domain-containing protein [Sphingomonas oligophenolica]TPG07487.1 DUF72 domain-containing protein [Sphingomonas oligophenolica]
MTTGALPPADKAEGPPSGHCDEAWPTDRSILIGTAGWSIPRTAADAFLSAGTHLERYAAVFPAVEINSSFHRTHRRSTYERWAASVPTAFRFSVKMPKEISHKARLVDCGELLEVFLCQVSGLGQKLDVLLLQLPPSFAFDEQVASSFFGVLRAMLDPAVDVACEPRNASWFAGDADACLVQHKVARVLADPVLVRGGDRPGGWLGMTYRRLHGAPRVYHSAYTRPMIAEAARAIADEQDTGTSSWCVFDNTASGAATSDALALCAALKANCAR